MADFIIDNISLELIVLFGATVLLTKNYSLSIFNTKKPLSKYFFDFYQNEFYLDFLTLLCGAFLISLVYPMDSICENSFILKSDGCMLAKQIIYLFAIPVYILAWSSCSRLNIPFLEFSFFYIIVVTANSFLVGVTDFINMFLCLELQSFALYALVSLRTKSLKVTEAGIKYFVYGSVASLIFLAGVLFIYNLLGTTSLWEIYLLLRPTFVFNEYLSDYSAFMGAFLIVLTLFFKLGIFPFHFWTLSVYEGASFPALLVLNTIPKIGYMFMLIRILHVNEIWVEWFRMFILCVGALSVISGTMLALQQRQLKKIVFYSSIAQMGYVILPLSFSTPWATTASITFFLVYLILGLGIWACLTILHNDKYVTDYFWDLKEIDDIFLGKFSFNFNINSYYAVAFFMVLYALAGLPPFLNFLAKFYVLKVLLLDNYFIFAGILMIITAIGTFYYIKVIKTLFFEYILKYNEKWNFVFNILDYNWYLKNPEFVIIWVVIFVLIACFIDSSHIVYAAQILKRCL